MRIRLTATALAAAALMAVAATPSLANSFSQQAPAGAFTKNATAGAKACLLPDGTTSTYVHCNTPAEIRNYYDVNGVGNQGDGQTIVLVDAYGTPTGAQDLKKFQEAYFPGGPTPDFDQVCKNSCHTYSNTDGQGLSGPAAAAGWAGEATLDIEWAYAIAPKAHIVLLAVPPAETLGVQGFPNLFKAMSEAIDTYPAGTVFSQSFGVSEDTFGGAAQQQTAKFDEVYKKGNAKGDTFLASSGDDGTTGTSKQHKESTTYDHPTVGWPASSPYVTAVGGTQLQSNWVWTPTSDQAFVPGSSPRQRVPAYWAWANGATTEPVWNESWGPIATGGGPSTIYSRPDYQDAIASQGRIGYGGNHRGVPDLAWNAAVNGGVPVYTSFYPDSQGPAGWHIYGGTSAASPQVAGVIALANEQQRKSGQKPLGFVNPLLYSSAGNDAAAFHDTVPHTYGTAKSGVLKDNQLFAQDGNYLVTGPGPIAGWPTTQGWDQTTGFGSPVAPQFITDLRAARNAQP